ncbi:proline-rich protein 14-like [Narcine bancroftii]|uniref:proline-rich protein 14-like n=1 Tax=Narcine bancroftii TaxID=1343680 RepID=UPI0038316F81
MRIKLCRPFLWPELPNSEGRSLPFLGNRKGWAPAFSQRCGVYFFLSPSTTGASQPWTPSSEVTSPLPCTSWQLSPFIQGIRSKLEGFAAIFLSPLRTHLPWGGSQVGNRLPWGPETPPCQPSISSPPCQAPIRLTRSLSCPARPVSGTGSSPVPRPTSGTPPRHRRHTLGGVEPSREVDSTPHLLCLRKEVFPGRPWGPRREEAHSPPEGEEREEEKAESRKSPTRRKVPTSPRHSKVREHPVLKGIGEPCITPKKRRMETVLRDPQEGEITEYRPENLNVDVQMHVGKVSRFRIRKAPVRTNINLTPLGLPKPARMNKKEFSLEEIYTNKNYKAPADKRTFETIFEEPLTRDGRLVLTSQQRRRRALVFGEGSLPRKGKGRQRRAGFGGRPRLRSRVGGEQVELLLRQRLSELDVLLDGEGES